MIAFIQRYAIALLAGFLVAALVFGMVQTVRIEGLKIWPVNIEGLSAKADRLGKEAQAARDNADAWMLLRNEEQAQDKASFKTTAERCDKRVSAARDAGQAIREIINAPSTDAATGARAIIRSGQLRRIIGQAETAEPVGMSTGSIDATPR